MSAVGLLNDLLRLETGFLRFYPTHICVILSTQGLLPRIGHFCRPCGRPSAPGLWSSRRQQSQQPAARWQETGDSSRPAPAVVGGSTHVLTGPHGHKGLGSKYSGLCGPHGFCHNLGQVGGRQDSSSSVPESKAPELFYYHYPDLKVIAYTDVPIHARPCFHTLHDSHVKNLTYLTLLLR